MERHEIEAFLALADELHFGRAGARLGITTSRISQIVRVLERRIGVPLFERTSRRVSLTPTGRRLYDDLRPAYEQITAAVARAVAHGRGLTGELRVGFVGAAAGQLVMRTTERFRLRHADVDVRVREVQLGAAVARLYDDELDLLFGCFPIDGPGLVAGPVLLSEPRVLAVSARHPFARRSSVSLADLARDRLVAAPCSIPEEHRPAAPAGTGAAGEPAAETFQEVLTLVGAGHGMHVVGEHVTRFYARPDVTYVPFDDAPPLEWGPVWHTARATARTRAFVDAAVGAP